MQISELGPEALSNILREGPGNTFLRLGDGELRFLLEVQGRVWQDARYDNYARVSEPDEARGTLGLKSKDYKRLLDAYERCTVLDVYGGQRYNSDHLRQLVFDRSDAFTTISSSGDRPLLNVWTMRELKSFLAGRRTLVCGAEAALQRELMKAGEYLAAAGDFWPADAVIEFRQPPDDGRFLSDNLDDTKQMLLRLVDAGRYDNLLLCLGGTAKILCFEIAQETGVCALDWGSMLRALTYSGSDGFASWRASHNPFFFRVPLRLYFPAMLAAFTGNSPEWYLGKVHSQLVLNLHHREPGCTRPADVHESTSRDFSAGNLEAFAEDYDYYAQVVLPQFRSCFEPVREFHDWLIRNRIPFRVRFRWRFLYQIRRVRREIARRARAVLATSRGARPTLTPS